MASVALAGCTTVEAMPLEFASMAPQEAGCIIKYGDAPTHVVGPLGPSDHEVWEPNGYTMFRIGRTASDIVVVVQRASAGSNGSVPLNDLPDDGIVARGGFMDSGNPGYTVTCWRGSG